MSAMNHWVAGAGPWQQAGGRGWRACGVWAGGRSKVRLTHVMECACLESAQINARTSNNNNSPLGDLQGALPAVVQHSVHQESLPLSLAFSLLFSFNTLPNAPTGQRVLTIDGWELRAHPCIKPLFVKLFLLVFISICASVCIRV